MPARPLQAHAVQVDFLLATSVLILPQTPSLTPAAPLPVPAAVRLDASGLIWKNGQTCATPPFPRQQAHKVKAAQQQVSPPCARRRKPQFVFDATAFPPDVCADFQAQRTENKEPGATGNNSRDQSLNRILTSSAAYLSTFDLWKSKGHWPHFRL